MNDITHILKNKDVAFIALPRDNITRVSKSIKSYLDAHSQSLFGKMIVLDVSKTDRVVKPTDFSVLRGNFADYGLAISGVEVAYEAQAEGARTAGLTPIGHAAKVNVTGFKPLVPRRPEPRVEEPQTRSRAHEDIPETHGTSIIKQRIRSGMEIIPEGYNAIVFGDVAQASDIVVQGSVQIFGTLGGRVIAGKNGDRNAFILATSFAPDLVSIAGIYLARTDIPSRFHGQHVLVTVDGDNLNLEVMD